MQEVSVVSRAEQRRHDDLSPGFSPETISATSALVLDEIGDRGDRRWTVISASPRRI
jgi:hypothetical protein